MSNKLIGAYDSARLWLLALVPGTKQQLSDRGRTALGIFGWRL